MRSFTSGFNKNQLKSVQQGIFNNFEYKGIKCLKNPFDLAIYMKVLWDVKPATIIELGSKHGGSAAFFSDISKSYDLGATVYSIDLHPPDLELDNVYFIQGDVRKLAEVFEQNQLFEVERPCLVIEDSAHDYYSCSLVLDFFELFLLPGEYLVMEDGILDELGLSEKYNGGPNRAIAEYLKQEKRGFAVAEEYCDMFGYNLTYNPNGYLVKQKK